MNITNTPMSERATTRIPETAPPRSEIRRASATAARRTRNTPPRRARRRRRWVRPTGDLPRKPPTGKKKAPAPTEGAAALQIEVYRKRATVRKPGRVRVMPPQKASKSQPKADASEKQKSKDRDWLTTAELAAKTGWREHALRDALR